MTEIYRRYFAKDRALRPLIQHFLVALIVLLVAQAFVFENTKWIHIALFFVATYIIDLDGVFTVLCRSKYSDYKNIMIKYLVKGDFESAGAYTAKNHKKINDLIIHKFYFYILFDIILVISILLNQTILGYIYLAFVTHMSFDILDDIVQLGHTKNWI